MLAVTRMGYNHISSIFSWIGSKGVQEVEQISILDDTTFPEEVKPFVSFLETFLSDSEAAVVCSLAAGESR